MRECESPIHKGNRAENLGKGYWWLKDPEWKWWCPNCNQEWFRKMLKKELNKIDSKRSKK